MLTSGDFAERHLLAAPPLNHLHFDTPSLLRATPWVTGPAIEYAGYFSRKIEEVGRKRAICISPENVVSLLSTVRRAPDGALFSSPKGRFTVRATVKTVALTVKTVAQVVFRVAHAVLSDAWRRVFCFVRR